MFLITFDLPTISAELIFLPKRCFRIKEFKGICIVLGEITNRFRQVIQPRRDLPALREEEAAGDVALGVPTTWLGDVDA